MIKKYIKERRSWIILFILLQAMLIFIAYIDSTIPIHSVFYIVFLSILIFIFFFIMRYHKETKFYKSIESWDHDFDMTKIVDAQSPFEKIIEESVSQQAARYKKDVSHHLLQLEQEKDELLSWVHEVKTPLTTMQLMIERIEDDRLKAQLIQEWLRIHLLVDQQLHHTRIPFIKNDLYIEKTELEPIINREIKGIMSWCIQKGIGFDMSLEVPKVLSDAKWLGFMIRQLLTNSVKYSEVSDIQIKSYLENGQTKLLIQDFGRGIDSRDLSRIFDKGFTSTLHHDNKSTGMGLYLTKKVAKALQIKVDVDSSLYQGTTFILTFPKKNEFVNITSM